MTAAPPAAADPWRVVLYRAGPGILYRVVVGLMLAVLIATMVGAIALALLVPARPHWPLAIVCLVMLMVLGAAVAGLLRPAFVVTAAGIVDRTYLGTRRIPWPEVSVIEIDPALMNRGATVVVRRDGSRVRSAITGSRFTVHRGESPMDHGQDLLQPARPTRAAIDAHRRWGRGELR